MTTHNAELGKLLERLDLHEIEQLKAAKEAITFLEGRRRQLQEQMAEVEAQIAQVKEGKLDTKEVLPAKAQPARESGAGREQPKRKARAGSLASKIVEVLEAKDGRPMSVQEIAEAVRAAGYQSESRNFVRMVNIVLYQMDETESAGRGLYRLKPNLA